MTRRGMKRIALTGGTVVDSLLHRDLVDADLVVDDGRIAMVGAAPDGIERRDCSGCLIMPGLVCAHHHLYSSLARGMPYSLDPPKNFLQILQRIWWRLDRALDEESVRASALVGGMEALLSGTTTVIDHHASPNFIEGSLDVIANALDDLGLRSILCYEVTDRDGPERAVAGIEENRRFLKEERALARGMVGAHASFTMSEETLQACVELAATASVGIHIHVAEDDVDEKDSLARFGKRTAHRLADAGVLSERSLLAHCVHLDQAELDVLSERKPWRVHNARSNMNNAVGRPPVLSIVAGSRLVLGTDGIDSDMFAESKAAYFRLHEEFPDLSQDPNWPLEVLGFGPRIVRNAFNEEGGVGWLVEGSEADLVVLEYAPPTPITHETFPGHWTFGLSARHVRDVMVAGEWVVMDRRLTRVDQDEVAAKAREAAQQLWPRMEDTGPHPFEPARGG